jgi:hypothetical protein
MLIYICYLLRHRAKVLEPTSSASLVLGTRGDVKDKCNTIAALLFEILLKYQDRRSGRALQNPWHRLRNLSWCLS